MFSSKSKKDKKVSATTNPNSTSAVSVLTAGTIVEGNFESEVDLRLEGTINGEVVVKGKVVLGASGLIEGTLHAAEAVVHGRIVGNLFINTRLHLAATAVIEGDITATQFKVEEGAVYRGKCNTGKGVL